MSKSTEFYVTENTKHGKVIAYSVVDSVGGIVVSHEDFPVVKGHVGLAKTLAEECARSMNARNARSSA